MKHLKKYKIFEAEIKRTFGEWLENPKAPSKSSFIYEFKFPVRKEFNFNDNDYDTETLLDFIRTERGDNVYKQIAVDLSNNFTITDIEDEDQENEETRGVTLTERDVKANLDQYFEEWLKQEYDDHMDKFLRMYDLDSEDDYISEDDFESLKEDFNESKLEQYYTSKEYNQDFEIHDMKVNKLQMPNIVIGTFETDRKLNEDEIESIRDYISGQCSDGWGEGFEQQQEKEEISGLTFYVSIKSWWSEGYPEWYLNITLVS